MDFNKTQDSSRSPANNDLRIVLLGKTGSGKSATGNTILGRKEFETEEISLTSVTSRCQKETGHFDRRTVSVIDTPGVFDTKMTEQQLKSEIEKCIMLSLPGPHIFLLVLRLDARFTDEEKRAVKWIKDNFGEEASKYTMVVFTRGDMLNGGQVEEHLARSPELREVVSDCRAGYFVFDNTRMENRTQVADLIENIDRVVQLNGNHYTSSIYEEVQKRMEWNEWWSRCGDVMSSAGNSLLLAAAAGLAIAGEGRVVGPAKALLLFTGAAKLFEGWMKPKANA